jgi:hypothetical protein
VKHRRRDLCRLDDNILVGGKDGIRHDERVNRLAEAAGGERLGTRKILARHDQQVHVPIELEMLKPIVEHMHGAAQVVFGDASRQVAIRAGEDRDPRKLAREHERFISRAIEICTDAVCVSNDHHSIASVASRVAAAENGRPLSQLEKQSRNTRGHRRFPAPPDGQVADADDGISQAPAKIGAPRVPLAPPSRSCRVQSAQQRVIRRTFGTARRPLPRLTA